MCAGTCWLSFFTVPSRHAAQDLIDALEPENPTESLWALCDSGQMEAIAPEIPLLRMEQDPIHRHKDCLLYTSDAADE